VFGPDHSKTLPTQYNLAWVLLEQGKLAQAEKLFRQTLTARRKFSPADDPNLANALIGLGFTLIKLDRPTEAEPLLREAMEIEQKKAPDNWGTFETRNRLGVALLGQKKYAEAESLIVQGYEGMKAREAKIPPQHKKRLTEAAERVVQLYDAWGKPDQAAAWRKRFRLQQTEGPVEKH
jgi:eukaryotic-like serine/threonine-protein kinase